MNRADSKNINSCKWTEAPRGAALRPAPALLALVGSAVLAGCLIIPVDYHTPGSRHNVTMAATNALRAGVATREDVLLALGEPDYVSEDGQRFGYFWSKVKAVVVVASYGAGAGHEITRSYLVETSFDPSNRVSDVRLREQWGDSVSGDPKADEVPEGNLRDD